MYIIFYYILYILFLFFILTSSVGLCANHKLLLLYVLFVQTFLIVPNRFLYVCIPHQYHILLVINIELYVVDVFEKDQMYIIFEFVVSGTDFESTTVSDVTCW